MAGLTVPKGAAAATLVFAGIILASVLLRSAVAQNCSCAAELCCSRWGYCGNTTDFCGAGCRSGPCFAAAPSNGVSVADIVTQEFFDGIIGQADASCEGQGFYTRAAFLKAAEFYPQFGTRGTVNDSRREIAAFFGQVTHETGHFCYINEINGSTRDYCDESNTQYPCVAGKNYFGRGPIQLSWNFNYGPAGESIGFDGLGKPEAVGEDPLVAFRTALWYWTNFVQQVIAQGFGATIRAINGALECDGRNPATVNARVRYYTEYCQQLGVSPGTNLTC